MTIADIFESMDYGPAPESPSEALAWLADRGGIAGHYINGAWGPLRDDFATINPATGARLAGVTQGTAQEVETAVAAARAAQINWAKDAHGRARVLYAIARGLQKHSRLLAVMETLDTGKPIRESRDIDVPLAIRHFYYHAGMAQLMDSHLPDAQALGVCGQIIPWNFPLLMLAWKVAPALAMGNTVVLKPAEYTPLSAMIICDICTEAGVPPGVVNVITGDGATGQALVEADIDKLAFTGSTAVGRAIRKATAGRHIPLTLELGGKSPYIVFDDADLDSAVEGLVDAIWFNQGQVCCAGSRLLVHEPIADVFITRLKTRMKTLRVGDPLDKCTDIGAIVDPAQRDAIAKAVSDNTAGETFQTGALPDNGCYFPPTLITGLHPADRLMQEEIFGPVLVSTTFRTPAEAVTLANNTRYGLAATVWSENINLALDIAPKLAAGIVWINGTNMMDAAAGFGGVRESGYGREGGWEGLKAYTKPKSAPDRLAALEPFKGTPKAPAGIDRTAKLYIGGKQSRPDGGYSRAVFGHDGAFLAQVPEANRKDIRNAVEAAQGAASWGKTTGHLRAQILYYLAENLDARRTEFAQNIDATLGQGGQQDVDRAIGLLFSAAALADKVDGAVKSVPIRGIAAAMREPIGVIGVLCPEDRPLSGVISACAIAMAMGNRVVLCSGEVGPQIAANLYQVLETSDVPAGVVNILTGRHTDLVAHLAAHAGVDAMWSLTGTDHSYAIEAASVGNLKRTWMGHPDAPLHAFTEAATQTKTVWIPYGE